MIFSIIGVLNMLRGFFIFLVFICKPSVWKFISKKHPKLVGCLQSARVRCRTFDSRESEAVVDDCSGEMTTTTRTRMEESTRISFIIRREETIQESRF